MSFFEYPYVIITILAAIFLVMALIGLYFTMKSVKTAAGTVEKGFCGMGKIENTFDKAGAEGKNRCVIYISISLSSMKRLYSESKVHRICEQVKRILLNRLAVSSGGEITLYDREGFVALNTFEPEQIEPLLDRVYKEIHALYLDHGAVNTVCVHFGCHATRATDVSFQTALERAKQACSMAEDKNVLYCRWDNLSGKEFQRKISMENSIRSQIENNRFFLEYQPIVSAETNRIIGAEVLTRLNSPTEGILTPRAFLSAVNNVGLHQTFDCYVFEKTCKWIASDLENRAKYLYTINFSRHTLCDPGFAEHITRIAHKYQIDPACIAVEILEDKSLDRDEKNVMVDNLTRLREKGIRILLDDFGKGYTGFGDLTDFAINIVKIDKSITANATDPTGFLILKNIIRTAHDLGFQALCEGIETEEHKKIAADAGCDLLQGYYLHRPMPVTQFETLFET